MEVVCEHCGKIFERSCRHKNQRYCSELVCQRARKANWQREKMSTDRDYRLNQRLSQATWVANNPDYWKHYRKGKPAVVERNRMLQSIRNRHRRKTGDVDRKPAESDCKDGRVKGEAITGSWAIYACSADCKDGRVKS